MKNAITTTLTAASAVFFLAATAAHSQEIQERKENQQDRIAEGVQSGELTAGETARLEGKESSLNQEERDMRQLDNGKLTTSDRKTLNQQQNKLSGQIYQDKHNDYTQGTGKGEIGQRKENQQDRIAQGIKSGQLTAGETANLEHKESALNHEEHNMRQLDNGKLTGQDRKTLNHQQNKLSKQIYTKKHNSRTQPK
jgi:hypothetical protein